jgi:phosphoserine phosphatase
LIKISLIPIQLFFLICYKLNILDSHKAKEGFLIYLANENSLKIKKELKLFWDLQFPDNFNHVLLEKIIEYNNKNITTVCISASPKLLIEYICDKININKTIATNIKLGEKIKISGNNCRGREKINRLWNEFDCKNTEIVFAVSDNNDDIELLLLAKKHQIIK